MSSTSGVGVLVGVLVLGGDRVDLPLDPLADRSDDLALLGGCVTRRPSARPSARQHRVQVVSAPRVRAPPPRASSNEPPASEAFSRNFARTCVGAHRVLGRAQLVREVRLERRVRRAAGSARRRGRHPGTSRTRASRSAPSRASASTRGSPSASRRVGGQPDAAVDEHRRGRVLEAELPLVLACAARPSPRPARARATRRPRGTVTHDLVDLVRVEARRESEPVAPSEPWMKWQAGNALNAIRGVSQRSPRSASCGSRSIRVSTKAWKSPKRPSSTAGRALGAERRRAGRRAAPRAPPRRGGSASSRSRRRGRRRAPRPCCRRSRARSPSSASRQPAQPGGGGGRAEDPADRGRVEAARVELPGRRHPDPRHDLVAGDDRRKELAARRAAALSATAAAAGHDDGADVARPSRSACRRSRGRGRASRSRTRRSAPAARRPRPITDASGSPPSSAIAVRPSPATPSPCAARPQPSTSSTCSFAASTTSLGNSVERPARARTPRTAPLRSAITPSIPRRCPGSCAPTSGAARL